MPAFLQKSRGLHRGLLRGFQRGLHRGLQKGLHRGLLRGGNLYSVCTLQAPTNFVVGRTSRLVDLVFDVWLFVGWRKPWSLEIRLPQHQKTKGGNGGVNICILQMLCPHSVNYRVPLTLSSARLQESYRPRCRRMACCSTTTTMVFGSRITPTSRDTINCRDTDSLISVTSGIIQRSTDRIKVDVVFGEDRTSHRCSIASWADAVPDCREASSFQKTGTAGTVSGTLSQDKFMVSRSQMPPN